MNRQATAALPVTSLGILLAASDLLQAFDYAADAGGDLWQFAVEWRWIRARGASRNDVRWLLARKFAEHARETTPVAAARRTFEKLSSAAFPVDTSLVLTLAGATALRPFLSVLRIGLGPLGDLPSLDSDRALEADSTTIEKPSDDAPGSTRHVPAELSRVTAPEPLQVATTPAAAKARDFESLRPAWDKNLRELRFGKQVVKRFRVPAENQEIILAVFEEEGWPESIDDPLPPAANIDPKRRLQATIKSLNRHQIVPSLRFHGNGGGRVIYWNATRPRRK